MSQQESDATGRSDGESSERKVSQLVPTAPVQTAKERIHTVAPLAISVPLDRFESAERIDWIYLIDRREYIDSNTTLEEVQELFKENPIRYLPVLHHDKILGLCSEEKISRLLGLRGGLGFALYSRSSVSQHLLREDFRITRGDPVHRVLEKVFSRPENTFHDDVILQDTNDKYLGLISVRTLTGLQHRIVLNQHKKLEKQIIQLENVTGNLNAANEELGKARDQAMDATRMKSAFLANMSHEIRTPMNGVIGMINILLKTNLEEQQSRYAKTAKNSAEALLTIINDILDFSKIEAGKMTMESLEFDVNEIFEETIELLSERAHSKGIDLFSHVQHDIPRLLIGDPTRLRQILLNLVGNAIKFTDKGEVIVRAIREAEDEKTVTLRIAVIDSGIGLSQDAQDKLFQAFVQADGSTTRKYGGTGLGLAICKKIVELMGGKIGVDSILGKGSTFWFTIPLPKPDKPLSSRTPFDSTLWGLRLLLVDDSQMFRQLAISLIQSWNMMGMGAASGEEALTILKKQAESGIPFDIAILDYQMPGMDGLELAQKIAASPLLAHTKVILLTSYSRSLTKEMLSAAHIISLVEKPLKNSDLYNALLHASGRQFASPDIPKLQSSKSATSAKSLHLLIVDDSETNQEVALYQVKLLGHTAEIANNGAEALHILSEKNFDGILMDGQMPIMDGYEATQKIRSSKSNVLDHGIYIIAMTANAMQGDREKCLDTGMNDYVSKPVVEKDLVAALNRCLEHLNERNAMNEDPEETPPDPSAPEIPEIPRISPAPQKTAYFPQKLVDMFIAETNKRLDEMDAALKTAPVDQAHVTRIAHTIKGTAGNFMATELESICREMESEGRNGNMDKIKELLPGAHKAYSIAINRLLPTPKP